jgi:hypothetical protein
MMKNITRSWGYPPKKNKERTQPKITENAIRQEHNLPPVYSHLPASALDKPELAQEIKLQSLAHQTTHAFLQLLESPDFLKNPNRLSVITSLDTAVSTTDKAHSNPQIVVVRPNPHSTPPVLGNIYRIDTLNSPLLKPKDDSLITMLDCTF